MHIRQIGHNMNPLYGGIIDVPVIGWPDVPFTRKSYGDWYTKWLAQNGVSAEDMVDNADNYARQCML